MGTARIALIGVFALSIAANVIQFGVIDAGAPENYQAISRKPSSDIVQIVSQDSAVERIYGPYWDISEQQPNADIVVSADDVDAFTALRFFSMGYGRADSITLSDTDLSDVTSLDELLEDPLVTSVKTGTSSGHGHSAEDRYYIRGECSDEDSPALVFGHLPVGSGHAFVIVDSCLLPNSGFTQ